MKKLLQAIQLTVTGKSLKRESGTGSANITPRLKFFLLLIMVFSVCVIYSNILEAPFVFDDFHITEARSLRLTNLSFDSIIDRIGGVGRSIPMLTLALNYYFGEFNVIGYHIVNIIIHIMTGILLFFFIKATLALDRSRAPGEIILIAFFAAFLWLVHPLQIQAVTFTIQRLASIAAMFYILSFLLYVKARLAREGWQKALLFAGCILSGFLAVASKEIAGTLPGFILLYELYFLQDFKRIKSRKYLIYAAVIIFVISMPVIWHLLKGAFSMFQASARMYGHSISGLLLSQPRIFICYFGLFLFPHPSRLNIDHDFIYSTSLLEPLSNIPALIIICAVLICAVLLLRKDRLISFSILWVIGNYIIRSSFFGYDTIFEHRMYLSSMMFSLILVIIVFRYLKPKVLALGILCISIAFCSFWTYERNKIWRSEYALWSDSVKKSPNKARPRNNLGLALAEMGRLDEAKEQYYEALKINPIYHKAFNNLGNLYEKEGRYEEAISVYENVLERKPTYVSANYNIANIYMKVGDFKKAENHYVTALIFKPDHVKSIANLATLMVKQGKIKEAVMLGDRALELEPGDAEIMTNLGGALLLRGEIEIAIHYLEKALTISPDIEEARINLKAARAALPQTKSTPQRGSTSDEERYGYFMRRGAHYLNIGTYWLAVDEFRSALSLRPHDYQALNSLSISYIRQHEYYNALITLKKLLLVEPLNASANYNIACMYSLLDKPSTALFWLGRAVDKGYDKWDLMLSDPDLENVRNLEEFSYFIKESRERD